MTPERGETNIRDEILALLDSINATWVVNKGIVYVYTEDGEFWDFTEPLARIPSDPEVREALGITPYEAH